MTTTQTRIDIRLSHKSARINYEWATFYGRGSADKLLRAIDTLDLEGVNYSLQVWENKNEGSATEIYSPAEAASLIS